MFPIEAVRAGLSYLRRNPGELFHLARHAAGLRVVVPLDALRWLLGRLPVKKSPRDVVIGARPPAIALGATVDLLGNAVRIQVAVRVEELRLGPDELRVALRLSDFDIAALDPKSPVNQLFAAIDKSKPANLISFLPRRPAFIVEAEDDRLELDLLRVRSLAENPQVRRVLGVVTPVLVIREIATAADHLQIAWSPRLRRGTGSAGPTG